MRAPLLLVVFGCSEPAKYTPAQTLAVIATAEQRPTEATEVCADLPKTGPWSECLLAAAEKLPPSTPDNILVLCALLEGDKRGECHFRLAERTENIKYCQLAQPFQEDCQLHLFTKKLLQRNVETYAKAAEIARDLQLDLTEANPQTVVYRHLLSRQEGVAIPSCTRQPNTDACRRAAEGLYVDRLRYARDTDQFPCSHLGAFEHHDDPLLKKEYLKFKAEVCP